MENTGRLKTAHLMKKCYACFTPLQADAAVCHACGAKVKDADKNGIAKKPTDWWQYLVCLSSWIALLFYGYWLFFVEK